MQGLKYVAAIASGAAGWLVTIGGTDLGGGLCRPISEGRWGESEDSLATVEAWWTCAEAPWLYVVVGAAAGFLAFQFNQSRGESLFSCFWGALLLGVIAAGLAAAAYTYSH